MMPRLAVDECIIGKVPAMAESEYESAFANITANEEGLITWHFYAEYLNTWSWRFVDHATL